MAHRGILGVRIQQAHRFFDPELEHIGFELFIGQFEKGDNKKADQFVTNPAIRQTIRDQGLQHNAPVGTFWVEVDHATRTVTTSYSHPVSNRSRGFVKNGIASFAEFRIERALEREFKGYTIRTSDNPSMSRQVQLAKRGRTWREAVPISSAAALTRKYVADGMKRFRLRTKNSSGLRGLKK